MALLAVPTMKLDLALKQATDVTITLTVVGSNGKPITDTSGYTARALIRASPLAAVLFEWNTTPGAGIGTISISYSVVTLTSTVVLTLSKAQTLGFTWTAALWDCMFTNPAGQTTCLVAGSVTVEAAITY